MASSTLFSLFTSPIIFSVNNGLGGSQLLKDKDSRWNSTDYLLPALTLTEEQATSGDSFDGTEILNNDSVKVAAAARNNSPTSETLSESILSEDKKTPREVIYIDSKRRHKYYKTELCRSWDEFGFCRYGTNCQFAHGKSELVNVVRHPKYKTVACRSYAALGYCYYGARCRFLHKNAPTPILETAAFRDWSGQVLFRRLPVFIKLSLGHVIGKSPEELSTQLFSFE